MVEVEVDANSQNKHRWKQPKGCVKNSEIIPIKPKNLTFLKLIWAMVNPDLYSMYLDNFGYIFHFPGFDRQYLVYNIRNCAIDFRVSLYPVDLWKFECKLSVFHSEILYWIFNVKVQYECIEREKNRKICDKYFKQKCLFRMKFECNSKLWVHFNYK